MSSKIHRDRVAIGNVILSGAKFQCTKCLLWKPASAFGLRRMGNGTIRNQPQCMTCRPPEKR